MNRSSMPPRRVLAGPARPVTRPRLALASRPGLPPSSARVGGDLVSFGSRLDVNSPEGTQREVTLDGREAVAEARAAARRARNSRAFLGPLRGDVLLPRERGLRLGRDSCR